MSEVVSMTLSRPSAKEAIRKVCYLHGGRLELPSKDHVIARQLFSPNSIENPLILTACTVCNQKKENDEAYATLYIQTASANETNSKATEAFKRTINNAKKQQRH